MTATFTVKRLGETMPNDFIIKNIGKAYYVYPVSQSAEKIIKKWRGVIMRPVRIEVQNLDEFLEMINKKYEGVVWTYDDNYTPPIKINSL